MKSKFEMDIEREAMIYIANIKNDELENFCKETKEYLENDGASSELEFYALKLACDICERKLNS